MIKLIKLFFNFTKFFLNLPNCFMIKFIIIYYIYIIYLLLYITIIYYPLFFTKEKSGMFDTLINNRHKFFRIISIFHVMSFQNNYIFWRYLFDIYNLFKKIEYNI